MYCLECGKPVGSNTPICEECLAKLTENQPAGFWLRFSAACIDYLIVALMIAASKGSIDFLLRREFPDFMLTNRPPLELILLIIYGNFYYTAFEGSTLRGSIGKLFMGLKVVNGEGHPVDIVDSFFRNLAKTILAFGFFLCALGPKYRALHDKASNTEVVRVTGITVQRRIIVGFTALFAVFLWETINSAQPDPKPPKPVAKVPAPDKLVTAPPTLPPPPKDDYEAPSKDVYFISINENITPIIDTVATTRTVNDWPEIVFLFFDEPLSISEKQAVAKQRTPLRRPAYRQLNLTPPVFALSIALKKSAQTCNEFTYSGVYFSDLRAERPRTAELIFSSWNAFERATRMTCKISKGSKVSGKLRTEKTLVFPDKKKAKAKLNLNLDAVLR